MWNLHLSLCVTSFQAQCHDQTAQIKQTNTHTVVPDYKLSRQVSLPLVVRHNQCLVTCCHLRHFTTTTKHKWVMFYLFIYLCIPFSTQRRFSSHAIDYNFLYFVSKIM